MSIEDYLHRHYTPATAEVYAFEIAHYLNWMSEAAARRAGYADIVRYVGYLRTRYEKGTTINRIVHSVKCYYRYLQATGQREDHPCRQLRIKDGKAAPVQVQDLLDEHELKRLLVREERFAAYALRNRLILSLLVHQALLTRELCGLLIGDVDLERATIYVRETSGTNARTLPLQAEQVMLIHRYLSEYRARLIKQDTEALLISGRGRAENGGGIHYLVTTMRKVIPHKRLTPMTIRQSVIAAKLKVGRDLRVVQVFAGHRQPSSTEAYRTNNLEELRTAVRKYHPLK